MNDGAARIFVNAPAHASCADAPLARALAYLCSCTIGDEFTRRLDDAVRLERARPEWRRERMRLDMLLRDKFVEGRKEGIALGREEGIAEGREEGREEGIAEGRKEIGVLAEAMADAGRADEFMAALADSASLGRLLAEFGIA